MARTDSLSNFLTDVASAIKTKKGSEASIPAANFDTEILAIPVRGQYQTKVVNINRNGSTIVTPDAGYDAIEGIEIIVAIPATPLQTKTVQITSNGNIIILPDTGYDGMTQVGLEVAVPGQQINNQDKTITQNGTYTADQGYTGLGTVTVTVEDPEYATNLALSYQILGTSLPYIELEYIESTGTQYIDTGFVLKSTTDIEFEFAYITASWSNNWIPLAGVRNMQESTDNPVYTFFIRTTDRCVSAEYAGIDFGKGNIGCIIANQKYKFNCKNKKFYLNDDIEHCNYTTNNLNDRLMLYSCYIFGMNKVNSPDLRNLCMKLYSFKIWDSSILVRDFIPVKRKSDNEICLYDKVSNTFFTNQGTGVFTAGPIKT